MAVLANPPVVFISYARADARDLALRLHADLDARGIRTWLDTAAIPGGASWTEEIERAIDACGGVVAVLTRRSFRSNVCRAEQLRALRKGKVVVPLLAERDADRPIYLEHLNYRDVSDPGSYAAAVDRIVGDLVAGSVAPLPEVFSQTRVTVPPLPPHFVSREGALAAPRQIVTGDRADRLVGLHGMGGLGKTVLAQALCHDPVVQAAFPDGIIWLTIGPGDVELLEQLQEAGHCLDDSPGEYATRTSAVNRLKTQLRGKAVLLVLDDVVETAQLEPFRTEEQDAPRVRLLFTTRDKSIGLHWGAVMHPAPVFEAAQSVRLLDRWAGREDPASPAIAERFGHLPLALRIAGALMSEGLQGVELLDEIQHVSDVRFDRYSNTPDANLAACFDVSLARLPEEDRRLYDAFGVLTRSSRIPRGLVSTLWMAMRPELTEKDCAQIARALARRALLDFVEDRVSLHPLLHDYAAERARTSPESIDRCAAGLAKAAGDPSWVVRELAIEALGHLGGEQAVDVALQAIRDPDIDVRLKALTVLWPARDARAIPALIALLKEGEPETTLAAAQVLAAIGEPALAPLLEVLPALWGCALDDAISALKWIGDPRAIPALEVLVLEHADKACAAIRANAAAPSTRDDRAFFITP